MKKIKDFQNNLKEICHACDRPTDKLHSISITTTNPSKKYSSGRSWRNCYRLRLCAKCFNNIEKKIMDIIMN